MRNHVDCISRVRLFMLDLYHRYERFMRTWNFTSTFLIFRESLFWNERTDIWCPNVFCQWNSLCARIDNPLCVQMGNDPAPIYYQCFFFQGVTIRLLGLEVDMEPEIEKEKRWVICENCLRKIYLRSTGNDWPFAIFRLPHGCIFISIDKKIISWRVCAIWRNIVRGRAIAAHRRAGRLNRNFRWSTPTKCILMLTLSRNDY